MTDAAASFRLVYGPNAAKKVARRFGVAVVTAKLWLAGRAPTARELEIARVLIEECSQLELLIAETKKRWKEVADETDRPVARRQADRPGAPAGRVGGEVNK